MNRKTPILDRRKSVTPDAIDIKFGTRDYDVGATQYAKTYNNRHSRDPPGKGVKYNVQRLYRIVFLFFGDFLPSSRE